MEHKTRTKQPVYFITRDKGAYLIESYLLVSVVLQKYNPIFKKSDLIEKLMVFSVLRPSIPTRSLYIRLGSYMMKVLREART